MAATFPGGVKVFTTKQAGDQIASAHINDLQDEVVAVETELRKTTGSVVSHGSLAGLSNNDHPQYLLAATGKAADSDKLDGLNSTDFGRPVFLTTPLTSTDWDGDSYSTTAKTLIDLSEVFGVPAGVKAVMVRIAARDSGSSAGYCQLGLSPNSTAGSVAVQAYLQGVANDVYVSANGIVPCDGNGDVYYQIVASGTGTLDAIIEIWGYWL